MSEHDDDPFPDAMEEIGPRGRGKKRGGLPAPEDGPDEGDGVDRVLAFKPLNDFGNGSRLVTRSGDDLLAVQAVGWAAWNGCKWDLKHGDAEAVKRCHEVAAAVSKEARALEAKPGKGDPERVAVLFRWATACGNMSRVRGMLDAAEPYLSCQVDALDADPFLAAAPNGTLQLSRNTKLREARREDRCTRVLGADYDASAQCPRWDRFMEEILPDEEMRLFAQRIAGLCLTGSTREQKFFLFWGGGDNGKSTFIAILRKALGDYGMSSPVSTFLAKKEGSSGAEASPDLARLPGARLVTAAEPPEGARLDESRIKEMTGGDPMTVRHLNHGFFEFRPVFKAIILTNHQPTIRGTDHGIWRRVLLVPFTVKVEKKDRDLEAKLTAELPGILRWIVDGCEAWIERGLDPPPKAIAATERYRADQDPVGEFLAARCERTADAVRPSTGQMYEIDAKALRAEYKVWCEEEGLDPLPANRFGAKLSGHGVEKRKSNSRTVYIGLFLKGTKAE